MAFVGPLWQIGILCLWLVAVVVFSGCSCEIVELGIIVWLKRRHFDLGNQSQSVTGNQTICRIVALSVWLKTPKWLRVKPSVDWDPQCIALGVLSGQVARPYYAK